MTIRMVHCGLLAIALAACEPAPGGTAPAAAGEQATRTATTENAQRMEAAPEPQAAAPKEREVAGIPALTRGKSRIPASLHGDWSVVRQTVIGNGVQAYGDDDPELIGKRMRLTSDGAAWDGTAPPLSGRCADAYFDSEAPRTTAASELAEPLRRAGASSAGLRDLRFLCMGEASDWGPASEELSLLLLGDGRLALRWFDSLLLVLERRARS